MPKKRGLKGEILDEELEDSMYEELSEQLKSAIAEIQLLREKLTKESHDKPVKIELDEVTLAALIDSCGRVSADEVRKMLEKRQEKIRADEEADRKYNEEHGFRTKEQSLDAVSKSCEEVAKQAVHSSEWLAEFNKRNKKMRNWQVCEFAAIKRYGNSQVTNIIAHFDGALDKILNRTRVLKPERAANAGFWQMQRYFFLQMPCYWLRCVFFDKHTKIYLHILLVSCWMVTLSLIFMMSHDAARLERVEEKYKIIRLWSYVEDRKPFADRVRILDALFDDEKHNRQEINELIRKIRNAYDEQQRKK